MHFLLLQSCYLQTFCLSLRVNSAIPRHKPPIRPRQPPCQGQRCRALPPAGRHEPWGQFAPSVHNQLVRGGMYELCIGLHYLLLIRGFNWQRSTVNTSMTECTAQLQLNQWDFLPHSKGNGMQRTILATFNPISCLPPFYCI